MFVVETFPHGVQTVIRDDDAGMIHYHVLLHGKLVWERKAKRGTHQRQLDGICRLQHCEANHLLFIATREEEELKKGAAAHAS